MKFLSVEPKFWALPTEDALRHVQSVAVHLQELMPPGDLV